MAPDPRLMFDSRRALTFFAYRRPLYRNRLNRIQTFSLSALCFALNSFIEADILALTSAD